MNTKQDDQIYLLLNGNSKQKEETTVQGFLIAYSESPLCGEPHCAWIIWPLPFVVVTIQLWLLSTIKSFVEG